MAFFFVLAVLAVIAVAAPFLGADSRNLSSSGHQPQWPGLPESVTPVAGGPLALEVALHSVRSVPTPRSAVEREHDLIR